MPRKVFFSFHYDDVTRANVVRNCDVITRQYQTGVRFYDKSLWEEAKKQGPVAIKRMINGALEGSSVTCLLIGQQTWQRPWVRYEILKSMACGNGIFGVQIHDVGFDPQHAALARLLSPPTVSANALLRVGASYQPTPANSLAAALLTREPSPTSGPNPLRFLGYTIDRGRSAITFHDVGPNNQWRQSEHVDSVSLSTMRWCSTLADAGNLENLFPVYDWKKQDGHTNFPLWVEWAAKQVGR